MVHFPGFATPSYGFRRRCSEFTRNGFPHSEISGSLAACASPELIAACHVLRRLLAPRHPPYALSSLTTKFTREQYPLRSTRFGQSPRHYFRRPCSPYVFSCQRPAAGLGRLPDEVPCGPRCHPLPQSGQHPTPQSITIPYAHVKRNSQPVPFSLGTRAARRCSIVTASCFPAASPPRSWWIREPTTGPTMQPRKRAKSGPIMPSLGNLVGLGRVELPTSRLSGVRSNHLSYRPTSELAP